MQIQSFTFNPFQENTYVVYNDEKEALIIDPGCYSEMEEKRLSDFISSNNLEIKQVVNTHLHIDHIFGNAFIEETYHIKASANYEDKFWLESIDGQAKRFGLKLRRSAPSLGENLQEGDQLRLGSEVFEIFQIPGHSPGGIALYHAKNNCVFVGDSLFENSVGRTDLQGGNYELLIEKIQSKLMVLPENTVVYSGHGPSTTIGREKMGNPFLKV